jgi:uncharacterized DUF497 family protein
MGETAIYLHAATTYAWDRDKATANIAHHQLAFEEAVEAFADPYLVMADASQHGQQRWKALGYGSHGLLTVIHAETDGDSIRIVSAWRATSQERNFNDQRNA